MPELDTRWILALLGDLQELAETNDLSELAQDLDTLILRHGKSLDPGFPGSAQNRDTTGLLEFCTPTRAAGKKRQTH
jgi:hypothetical protein